MSLSTQHPIQHDARFVTLNIRRLESTMRKANLSRLLSLCSDFLRVIYQHLALAYRFNEKEIWMQ